jgi:hypothetical protein
MVYTVEYSYCRTVNYLVTSEEVNHIYVIHENGDGLFACSRGRPRKEEVKIRLDCPPHIELELQNLRNDFLIKNNAKMLVFVSMATDDMIRLVSMYPEVWFMDTTAG